MPGLDAQSALAVAAGFTSFFIFSLVRFVVDKAKIRVNQPEGGTTKQANVKLLGNSTLETLWTIGTGSLVSALSS